jgi:hypothetical protein
MTSNIGKVLKINYVFNQVYLKDLVSSSVTNIVDNTFLFDQTRTKNYFFNTAFLNSQNIVFPF